MAALETTKQCSECGQAHNFFYRGGDLLSIGNIYSYTCPVTNTPGEFIAGPMFGMSVEARPENAVSITDEGPAN
jgi:hypothetical protein